VLEKSDTFGFGVSPYGDIYHIDKKEFNVSHLNVSLFGDAMVKKHPKQKVLKNL